MATLRTQIEEEHLTCSICYNVFKSPKALPCLHTFCEHCIREYVVSRGFETSGEFPCPICQAKVPIPAGGIEQFPNNHMVKSLSDTVDKTRPVPKPRRSLQPKEQEARGAEPPVSEPPPPYTPFSGIPPLQGGAYPVPANYSWTDRPGPPHPLPPQSDPPPYSPPQSVLSHSGQYPAPYSTTAPAPDVRLQEMTLSDQHPTPYRGAALYPTIPPNTPDTSSTACSFGMLLKFGKKGASVIDFNKPLGLAVSDSCDFVITDTGESKIFVFDYKGQPKKAFHCDCRIKDVAVNSKNEIMVVVNKPAAAFRCYDMNGRCLGEHGKSITHEEANGIAVMFNGGAVITGKQNHSVYIMTDQYKLSSKFGRKGDGDGYFQSPAFVATDAKGNIVVSDDRNCCVQVFNSQGRCKLRFGGPGSRPGQLLHPQGVATDAEDNIIVADSGNHRVEMFSSKGVYLRTIVSGTDQLGEGVHPVNVALTPKGNIAVLLRGKYFAEVRLYSPLTSSTHGSISRFCFVCGGGKE
ncbi:uncharacterized protein LOC143291260 [Babylonia areolata]|uniref:uncharacterized protein LOC143291260 n=1 Tax=Babylonia areolata TaxID=304850 RepID=UPI003FD0A6EE